MTSDVTYAKEQATSGDFFGIAWNYDEDTKTVTITGTGKMHDHEGYDVYVDGDDCPWWEFNHVTENIIIEEGITHIGVDAFDNFIVTNVSISDSVTSLGADSFGGCWKLEYIKLPKSLKKIESGAFCSCEELKEIDIPDSVTSMGKWAFADCDNLSSVKLPKKLKTLQEGIFRNSYKLKSIKIPVSVTRIDANAFEGSGIRSITIPKNVTTLKNDIFLDCKNLKTITIVSEKISKISKYTFRGVNEKTVIKVPKKKLKEYKKMFYNAGLNKKVKIISSTPTPTPTPTPSK